MSSPEDHPAWGKKTGEAQNVVLVCANCSDTIKLWHCADSGCPWCAQCGTKTQPPKKEKK